MILSNNGMALFLLRYFMAFVLLLISACSQANDVHETRFIMGTLVKFTIAPADRHENIDVAAAISAAANEMQRIENAFTIYGDQSNAIKTFNATAPNTAVALPEEVASLLQRALLIKQQSKGAFDPALGGLNLLWGFSASDAPTTPPSAEAITKALPPQHCIAQTSMANGKSGWLRTDTRCLLDFGAIAKGYAIDQGIKILRQHGIKNAIINAGGDIRLIGKHGDKPWRIGIRHPRQQAEMIETLQLEGDVSIVTSGDYERFFIYQGKRYHHLINPQTGWPAQTAQSVTIIARNATLADAWSTAVFIQGKKGMAQQSQFNQQVLLIDQSGKRFGSLKPR
ncbi:MAG: FAD:protein FMN transferase [Mariprofundus sp.]|nr:FAD:protein FMN transferase [Mariprofundus sp.]